MNSSFYEKFISGRGYLIPRPLETLGVRSGFTMRLGGVSHGSISGYNFGFRVGDSSADVLENYRLLAGDMGFDLKKTVCARQTHTDNIRAVSCDDGGKGIFQLESDIVDTDALVTDRRGMALIVFTADCTPVLLYDPQRGAVAAVHAGWRGTVKNIAGKAVQKMCSEFGSRPQDILAAIGPSIGPCCFEIGGDTAALFEDKYLTELSGGKFRADLWSLNRDLLKNEGVQPENIHISEVCTMCSADKYYSYRTHKEHTGRQVAFIVLP